MGRLLVHFHVYYEDQIPWFLEKMENICGCEWDLAVSYSHMEEASRERILSFRPDAMMFQLENLGYDLWPFIHILKSLDISRYDYVMKLHTKAPFKKRMKWRSVPIKGNVWRDRLVDALLESPETFRRLIMRFEQDPSAGLFCQRIFLITAESPFPEDNEALSEEMSRIGLSVEDRHFCAGTMFLSRMAPFSFIVKAPISAEMFSSASVSHGNGSLAHVYERILSFVVSACGLSLIPVDTAEPHRLERFLLWYHYNVSPFFEGIFSLTRDPVTRVKYLTLFWVRIPLDKGKKLE